jgi:hypothetical protein
VSEEIKKKEREKLDRQRARKELRELGKVDRGVSVGGEYLRLARLKDKEKKKRDRVVDDKRRKGKRTKNGDDNEEERSSSSDSDGDNSDDDDEEEDGGEGKREKRSKKMKQEKKKVFSSEAVRMIGYNPTLRPGDSRQDRTEDDQTLQQRVRFVVFLYSVSGASR